MKPIKSDDRVVWVSIPLSPETAGRLFNLSNVCDAAPGTVAASLLHDVLADDEACHDATAPAGAIIH